MPILLKLLTGPQEGGELELIPGGAMRVGSDPGCDIVLVDALVPGDAFQLRLDGETVYIRPSVDDVYVDTRRLEAGVEVELAPYGVVTIGSTRCAVGSTTEAWPRLSWPSLEQLMALSSETPESSSSEEGAGDVASSESGSSEEPAAPSMESEVAREALLRANDERAARRRALRDRAIGIACWCLVLLLCLVGIVIASRRAWVMSAPQSAGKQSEEELHQVRLMKFNDILERYELKFEALPDKSEGRRLTGNLPTTAIRLYVEQLVRLEHRDVVCELTDDETLSKAVEELLWGTTNGCVRLEHLENRVATVSGMMGSEGEWKVILENISTDIPRLVRVESNVAFGDELAARLLNALEAVSFKGLRTKVLPLEVQISGNVLETRKDEFERMLQEARKYFPAKARLTNLVKWTKPVVKPAGTPVPVPQKPAAPVAVRRKKPAKAKAKALSISSISVLPYPCVVMSDGSRCTVGAVVDGYVIKQIRLDGVTVQQGDKELVLKP